MTIPEAQRSPRQQAQDQQRKSEVSRHTRALDRAQTLYLKLLRGSAEAIQYLKGRGLTGEIAARFGLGWSGHDRQALATVFDDYEDPVLVESGLVIESEDGRRYDRFRERVMFPIRNGRGTLIGFGGRIIGKGEPKYLNSPETPVFSKGQELYGLWEGRQAIRKEGFVIVVEGYMDVVGLAQLGLGNAVATLGTSTTPEHIKKLLRASDKVIFSFDGDNAGRKAAWRALQACLPALRDDITMRFLFLPSEHDPDSYIRAFGEQAFRACLNEADALSRFFLDELASRHNLNEAEGRASCLHEARPLLAIVPECALRIQIERELARLVQLTPEEMARVFEQAQAKEASRAAAMGHLPQPEAAARSGARPSGASGPLSADRGAGGQGLVPHRSAAADGAPGGNEHPPFDGYAAEAAAMYDPAELMYEPADPGHDDYHDAGWAQDGPALDAAQPGMRAGAGRAPARRGGGWLPKGEWKGKGKGKSSWRDGNRDDQGVIEPRRPVPTLARRLLRLILAHPALVDGMGDQQLEVLDHGPHLGMVRDLIVLAQTSGARHIGALLEAAEPDSDLHALLKSTRASVIGEEDLPDPQAEWDDALRRIEFDSIQHEMAMLAQSGLVDEQAKLRYQTLSHRKTVLSRAVKPDIR